MRRIIRLAVVLILVAATAGACGLFESKTEHGRVILYAVETSATTSRPVVINYRDQVETWNVTQNLSTTAAWVGEFPAKVGFDLLLNAHFQTAGDPDTLRVLIFVDAEIAAEDWCVTPGCTASLTMKVPKAP